MYFLTTTLFTILTITSALPVPTTLTPRDQDLTALEVKTDTLLFSTSMNNFQAARDAQDPPELDWNSNGCSYSPDNPLGFDFHRSCQRHDFGYHNYKAQNRFAGNGKSSIDSNFKKDMYDECDTHGPIGRTLCKGVANLYYSAVKNLGGK